ncbi:DNA cytosine methyltransferase [Bacillus inaquosorum]|uniref:DNA cytosine methyltransferase n=1 Tax=Bacillus inaquosorum TaxID=483913 RepID=UPI003D19F881
MNVLSLFDGMSCGQIALNKLGIVVDNYFASEIKENAIKVTQYNYPNTIQLGDVKSLTDEKLVSPKNRFIDWWKSMPGFKSSNEKKKGAKRQQISTFLGIH